MTSMWFQVYMRDSVGSCSWISGTACLHILRSASWSGAMYLRVVCKGGLNPKPYLRCHGSSEVKPPKAGIVLGWVTFLTLVFPVLPSIMAHRIVVGVSRWTGDFQPTMWESRRSPLGEIAAGRVVQACCRCSPLKWGSSLRGPVNFYSARISGLHIDLDLDNQLEDEATP